jgi:hypothetical protein
MKNIISVIILLFILNNEAKSQNAYSMYQLNRNDTLVDNFYFEDDKRYCEHNHRKNRFAKTMMYTGILAGGLILGEQASRHDYYINNTMIYGLGGVMTILATGIVLGSVNCLNHEINFAYTGNGMGVSMCLNSVSSQKRQL